MHACIVSPCLLKGLPDLLRPGAKKSGLVAASAVMDLTLPRELVARISNKRATPVHRSNHVLDLPKPGAPPMARGNDTMPRTINNSKFCALSAGSAPTPVVTSDTAFK